MFTVNFIINNNTFNNNLIITNNAYFVQANREVTNKGHFLIAFCTSFQIEK